MNTRFEIDQQVMVNVAKNMVTPTWEHATIYSIFITYKTNLYEVVMADGKHKTFDQKYIKEIEA